MGIMVYSLSWVMQDFYHQPYQRVVGKKVGFIICRSCSGIEPVADAWLRYAVPRWQLVCRVLTGQNNSNAVSLSIKAHKPKPTLLS